MTSNTVVPLHRHATTHDAETLSAVAHDLLLGWLEADGNRPSDAHKLALRLMLEGFAALITGQHRGRIAYPLPPGAGKSLSIVATITAMHRLGLPYTCSVAAERVESLCDLIRDLQTLGQVPDCKIGLVHSKLFNPLKLQEAVDGRAPDYASLPATPDPERRPYLFVTHNRAKVRADGTNPHVSLLTTFRPGYGSAAPRSICWWDESLLSMKAWTVPKTELEADVSWFRVQVRDGGDHDGKQALRLQAVEFLESCLPLLDAELEAQKNGADPGAVEFTPLGDLDAYRDALLGLRRRPNSTSVWDFLDIAHKPVRVQPVSGKQAGCYISFTVSVPEELDRMAILDASYPIRILEKLDSSISVPKHRVFSPEALGDVKSYRDVEVFCIQHGGGRNGITNAMKQTDRKLSREIIEIIKSIPSEERVLIVTFTTKEQGAFTVPIDTALLRHLEDGGVKLFLDELDSDGKPLARVSVLTWGQETSSNRFRDYQNVILAGILQRSDGDLIGHTLAQQAKRVAETSPRRIPILEPVPSAQLHEVRVSESVHRAFQAMCRSCIRKMRDGQALPAKVWIFYHEPVKLREGLALVMPGIDWSRRWKTAILSTAESRRSALAQKILGFLAFLPEDVNEIPSRHLRDAIGCLNTPTKSWQRAMDEALESAPWRREGATKWQRLVRAKD